MRELILERLQQQPFEPFRISLTNGSKYDILYPELAEVTETSLRLYRMDHTVNPPARTWISMIALRHIVSLEDLSIDSPVVISSRSAKEQ